MKTRELSISLLVLVGLSVACLLSACGSDEATPTPSESVSVLPSPFESPLQPVQQFAGLLAFHSERSGTLQVYLLQGDTAEVVRLSDDPAGDFEPDWSPDCRSLVFSSQRLDPYGFELYTVGKDGSGEKRLIENQPADDWAPAWSPAGDIIAYQTNQAGRLNICFVNTAGESQGCLEGDYNKATPAWSPDGSTILFVSDRDGDWDVYATDYPIASEPVPLTDNDASDSNPRFSPDGTVIAFASNPLGNFDIFVMNADGSSQVQLTNDAADDATPRWMGSDKIVFASQRTSDWELYLMDRDGSNVEQLTDSPGLDKWPVWCPGE